MGIGVTELLVILAIVVMLFGTKKLRTLGTDLGTAIKGFRTAISNDPSPKAGEEQIEATPVVKTENNAVDSKATQPK